MRQRNSSFGFTGLARRITAALWICATAFLGAEEAGAYSVMSHQAIIDAAWENELKPALKQRFPHITEEDLKKAHAYAYGGAIIQDLGYYPYGNTFFSDLTHYVRSADFILAMLRDAQDANEYAFALGANGALRCRQQWAQGWDQSRRADFVSQAEEKVWGFRFLRARQTGACEDRIWL
jgi:hypothetical protein